MVRPRAVCAAALLAVLFTGRAAYPELRVWPAWRPEQPPADADALPPGALARLGSIILRHTDSINSVAASADGRVIASASNRSVILWDASTGRARQRFSTGRDKGIWIAAGGNTLVAANATPEIVFIDMTTGRYTVVHSGTSSKFTKVAVSPDGSVVAAVRDRSFNEAGGKGAAWMFRITLWEASQRQKVRELDVGDQKVEGVTFSPDGKHLAELRSDGRIHLWDLQSGREQRVLCPLPGARFHGRPIFSPTGRVIACECRDDLMLVRQTETGEELYRRAGGYPADGMPALSPDGRSLAVPDDGGVRLHRPAGGGEFRHLDEPGNATSAVAFIDDGRALITGGNDGQVRVWDVASGQERLPNAAHAWQVTALAFSPEGRTLASRDSTGLIRLWDVRTGRPSAASLRNPSAGLRGVSRKAAGGGDLAATLAFTRNGRSLVCVDDGALVRRCADTLAVEMRWIARAPGRPRAVADLGNGRTWLAVPAEPAEVRVLDDTGREVAHVQGLVADRVTSVALAPDGRHVAVGVRSNCVLWDEARRAVVRSWDVQQGLDWAAAAFSVDGRLLAAWDDERGMRVFEVASGGEVACFRAGLDTLWAPAFAPDARVLATAETDGPILLWDLTGTHGSPKRTAPSAAELTAIWQDLLDEDAARAYRAVWRLANAPTESVPFLRERLRPAAPVPPGLVRALVADLDDRRFAVRQAAYHRLQDGADAAEAELRRAGRQGCSAETGEALVRILRDLDAQQLRPKGERLRALRAVQALEYMRDPQARELLKRLAQGAPDAFLTRAARERCGR